MRFLANENIPLKVINELKDNGYDILRVDELKRGMSDVEVLELATKEERVLITFDKDFGEIAVKTKRAINGIILLRMRPESADFIKHRLLSLLKETQQFQNKLIILAEDRFRERTLK
jgi:predicted nuclease of predicted toxin-antitoxin system